MTKKIVEDTLDFKSLNLYKVSGRDVEAEENGAWFQYTYENEHGEEVTHPDIMFKIRSFSSAAGNKYRSLIAKYKKEAKARTSKDLDQKVETALSIKALIESGMILDWKGIRVDGSDKDLPFSYAEQVLSDLTFDYAVGFIVEKASKPSQFREVGKEAATKN